MFNKPLQQLTAADIEQIVHSALPETDTVEFKAALSAKGGRDGWHDGANEVGERAKIELVREVIGFANSHGGTLFLGISETDDHPKRADGISAVRACADLASRITMFCRDLIEPPLAPHPAISSVSIDADAGVIIISVPASLNAPHRCTTNLESYSRRGNRTERMTMREIQDLTLRVDRGLTILNRRFEEKQQRFEHQQRSSTTFSFRGTAVPLSPLSAPIPGRPVFSLSTRRFAGHVGDRPVQAVFPGSFGIFRPILRGVHSRSNADNRTTEVELSQDGVVDVTYSVSNRDEPFIYAGWFMGFVANVLCAVDQLRDSADSPGTEYGVEFELRALQQCEIASYGGREYGTSGSLQGVVLFPRYSVRSRDEFSELVGQIEQDFWNAGGVSRSEPALKLEF